MNMRSKESESTSTDSLELLLNLWKILELLIYCDFHYEYKNDQN